VLLDFANVAHFFGFALLGDKLIDLGAQFWIVGREVSDDRMLGRELHRSRAVNGIDARGENFDSRARGPKAVVLRLRIVELEIDQGAFAAPDPVALHGADFLGPAVELVEIAQ